VDEEASRVGGVHPSQGLEKSGNLAQGAGGSCEKEMTSNASPNLTGMNRNRKEEPGGWDVSSPEIKRQPSGKWNVSKEAEILKKSSATNFAKELQNR